MTTQHEIAQRLGLPVHPPKIELFDLDARTNTDPKSIIRQVDEYRREPFGLYLRRAMPGHPKLRSLESWLLPEHDLRITRWKYHPGHSADWDFYVDIAGIEPGPARWRSVDHYLDILVADGRHSELLDVDEFTQAVRAELLDEPTAERAMRSACAALDGLARHGYRLHDWLREHGIELSWHGQSAHDRAIRSSLVPPKR
ncbi:DUF402 domain-containing protein [Saccharopolyspora gloriosae]|uniref:DUF402 domain-containing protein n=1 Tax=Saccharopolyspora gloriosae TaxID=455344 RepID=UPI001FB6262A|nr:DUF402 domain-containing protein [Saccharopolyspora gloriosae]